MGWFSSSKSQSKPQNNSCEKIRLKYYGENNHPWVQENNAGCGLLTSLRCAFLIDLERIGELDGKKVCLYFEEQGMSRDNAIKKARETFLNNARCSCYSQRCELDNMDLDFINSKK